MTFGFSDLPSMARSFAAILGEGTMYAGALRPDALHTVNWVQSLVGRTARG